MGKNSSDSHLLFKVAYFSLLPFKIVAHNPRWKVNEEIMLMSWTRGSQHLPSLSLTLGWLPHCLHGTQGSLKFCIKNSVFRGGWKTCPQLIRTNGKILARHYPASLVTLSALCQLSKSRNKREGMVKDVHSSAPRPILRCNLCSCLFLMIWLKTSNPALTLAGHYLLSTYQREKKSSYL